MSHSQVLHLTVVSRFPTNQFAKLYNKPTKEKEKKKRQKQGLKQNNSNTPILTKTQQSLPTFRYLSGQLRSVDSVLALLATSNALDSSLMVTSERYYCHL
jgi:hypothetical protein